MKEKMAFIINKSEKSIFKKAAIFILIFFGAFIPLLMSGCGGVTPPKDMIPPSYVNPTPANGGVRSKPAPGSLWNSSDSSDNLYADNVAFKLNDIVTIIVDNQSQVSDSSGTVLSHNSSGTGQIEFGSLSSAKPTGYQGSNNETFNGGGGVSESGQVSTTIEAQVVKVFPNGNVELKGESQVSINGETKYILVKGIVRPIDISPANTVLSSQIADERVWINGKGYVNNQQSPNWLFKIMEDIWPF